jgi:hypothetical protein
MSALLMAKLSTFKLQPEKSLACVAQPNQRAQKSNAAGQLSKHPERRSANTTVVDRIQLRPSNVSQKLILSTVKHLNQRRSSTDMTAP